MTTSNHWYLGLYWHLSQFHFFLVFLVISCHSTDLNVSQVEASWIVVQILYISLTQDLQLGCVWCSAVCFHIMYLISRLDVYPLHRPMETHSEEQGRLSGQHNPKWKVLLLTLSWSIILLHSNPPWILPFVYKYMFQLRLRKPCSLKHSRKQEGTRLRWSYERG